MFFACTGLLISWHERTRTRTRTSMGMSRRMRARSVILTSASLVRSRDDEDKIDRNLRVGTLNDFSWPLSYMMVNRAHCVVAD